MKLLEKNHFLDQKLQVISREFFVEFYSDVICLTFVQSKKT